MAPTAKKETTGQDSQGNETSRCAGRERCRHFAAAIDKQTGLNTNRQCVGYKGHFGDHGWNRAGEVMWLPDAPRDVMDAFAKAIK